MGRGRLPVTCGARGMKSGRKRARRLMRQMGLTAIYRKPHTSSPDGSHRIYPYLLGHLTIERPNQVWCADVAYIPMQRGFLYLVAVMDWATRTVLSWRLSNTLDTAFLPGGLAEDAGRLRQTGDLQHRPGQPVYESGVHRSSRAGRGSDLDGRQGPMEGQRLYRASLALSQIRVCLSARLRGGTARASAPGFLASLLQPRDASSSLAGDRTPMEAYTGRRAE